MKKTVLAGLVVLLVAAGSVSARELPEQAGDYADPQNPGVRVRVFVHEPRDRGTSSASLLACTEDPGSSAVVAWAGWKLPAVVTYRLNTGSTSLDLVQIAQNAFATWATPSGVTFTRGANTTVNRNKLDYQNIVAWGRTSGTALGVTYIRYYASSGDVVDVDTIMNQKFPWTWNTCSPTAYDALNILTHEIGHWVGLEDHYTDDYVHNTMFGYGSRGETKKNTLTAGDVAGVNAIY